MYPLDLKSWREHLLRPFILHETVYLCTCSWLVWRLSYVAHAPVTLSCWPIPSSLQTPHPTPPGQEQPPRQPSIHHSTPAPVSPPSSVGLGGGASVRQHLKVLEMSEGHGPQPEPASLHGQFTAKQRPKEFGDVPEGRQPQPASLPGRASHRPKPKETKPPATEQNWASL